MHNCEGQNRNMNKMESVKEDEGKKGEVRKIKKKR
jgi:hypothetical protein